MAPDTGTMYCNFAQTDPQEKNDTLPVKDAKSEQSQAIARRRPCTNIRNEPLAGGGPFRLKQLSLASALFSGPET